MKRRNFLKSAALVTGGIVLTQNLGFANTKKPKPIVVIHGGTSGLGLTKKEFSVREKGMQDSLKAAQAILAKGGHAIDAVIAAVKVMEDHEAFNAGRGAVFTTDGFNELDASIMDGATKNAGAVAISRHMKNPIQGARLVMEKTPHTLLVGEAADAFAEKHGLEMVEQSYFFTQHRFDQMQEAKKQQKILLDSDKHANKVHTGNYTEPYLGTVGAVALDMHGNLVAGTSTGGTTNKMSGRIGDSPIIGAGTYADNNSVALSCTGTGDIFIRAVAAHEVAALYKYKNLSAQKSAEEAVKQIALLGGQGGIVCIDKFGVPGFAWTKDKIGMFHGQATLDGGVKVFWPIAKP